MKVALVCTGLGSVNRGFEIFFRTLYEKIKAHLDVTLYKGKGSSEPGIRTLWNLSRDSRLWSLFGKTQKSFFRRYKIEQLTFAFPLLVEIIRHHYDVVHLSEYHLGRALLFLLRDWKHRPRIVLHNGHPLSPSMLHPFDHIQQLTLPRYQEGLGEGLRKEKMSVLPIGIDPKRYSQATRAEARSRFGIPSWEFVVLSVGAINRWHKRMDWTIQEISQIPHTPLLAIAGNHEEETEQIIHLGRKKMEGRVRFFDLSSEEIPILYRAADVFVLASLYEGFGIVFVEAMAAGIPVIAHHAPSIVWLLGDGGITMDMKKTGRMAETISSLMHDKSVLAETGRRGRQRALSQFSWDVLIPQYLEMYQSLRRTRYF